MFLEDLRTEYLTTPLGIAAVRPRFSWVVTATARGANAIAYQVVVASSREALSAEQADVWDSGRVEEDRCAQVEYAGPPLAPTTRCWWAVRVWAKDGQASDWQASWFETGLDDDGLAASWISLPEPEWTREDFRPCPFLRHEFAARERPRAARLYATALGLYEAHLNGQRVGDAVLRPGWTDYHRHVPYQVYDVTDRVEEGRNALGLVVGEGWFSGHWGLFAQRGNWGERPAVAAQLVLDYEDGTREIVATGERWRGAYGPLLRSDLLLGEIYDARREQTGWSTAGHDDHDWLPADVVPTPQIELVAQRNEPVRVTQEISPVAISSPLFAPSVLFDFGENVVGWTRLRVQAPRGTEIVLRHGEALAGDGTVYTANLRLAQQTERYICRGDGEEVYEPRFTFHGFRYVEVVNLPGEPTAATLTAVVAHSGMRPAGDFSCSEELVNQLQRNIVRSQRGNFLEVPTDCPQRNERLGWLGDARIFSRTACFNYDAAAFFTKWLDDVRAARTPDGMYPDFAPLFDFAPGYGQPHRDGGPGWSDAGVFLPWTLYEEYADERILADHFDAMAGFVSTVRAANPTLIRRERVGMNWGDWLSIPASDPSSEQRDERKIDSVHSTTPKDLFATAFFKRSAELVSRSAAVIGRDDDAARFAALAEDVREAFCREFVRADGFVAGDTQTAYVLSLAFDLLPPELRSAAGERLAAAVERHDGRLSTGITGTELLLPTLAAIGRADLAVSILLERGYPSWGYSIERGATSIWERWDGWTEERGFQDIRMNSLNHYALGAVGAWLYSSLGGIERLEPGYRRIRVRPLVHPPFERASATHRCIRGAIRSSWELRDGDFALALDVPVGTTAEVHVPRGERGAVLEGDGPAAQAANVRFLRSEDGCDVFEVPSGSYAFSSPALKARP